MSKRHPSDLSFDEMAERFCIRGGMHPIMLTDDPEHFPSPDYRDEAGNVYWHEETLRPWVRAQAASEILSRPQEMRELVQLLELLRKLARQEPLTPEEAHAKALQHFINAKLAWIFGR